MLLKRVSRSFALVMYVPDFANVFTLAAALRVVGSIPATQCDADLFAIIR
jgi:hypothetical protein